jgi:prevent-host-death family protein
MELNMKVAVSEFKAKCTHFLRAVEEGKERVEVTRRGKVIAVVSSSATGKQDPKLFLDCLHGNISFSPDWDEPLGDHDWDACR